MKKKIYSQFLITVGIAIIITAVLTTAVFYEIFKNEMKNSLDIYANIIRESLTITEDSLDFDVDEIPGSAMETLRITLIDENGTVLFDNEVDYQTMENHGSRPEVVEAIKFGEGESIRHSDTLDENTFYHAILLENGYVLRVAKEASSIWNIFTLSLPLMSLIILVTFMACFILTHFLTRSLISPIEEVANNMDDLDTINVYKEMEPFVVTIKKQHEDILKSARMRQEFTANVSHELKTPLTSISGYSELIENGMAGEGDVIRFAGEIHHSANRLLSLINDILRLSELDSGEFKITYEDVDLYEVAQDCIYMLDLHAKEHGVQISLKGEHAKVQVNKSMVEEMIYNLCDNAIRYNQDGGNVWVVVESDHQEISVLVSDDGIGISEENQKRIFERFYRVDKSRSKKTGGTGLGLAIVKHIVEQHGARLELTSAEKIGTTIKIIFEKKTKD